MYKSFRIATNSSKRRTPKVVINFLNFYSSLDSQERLASPNSGHIPIARCFSRTELAGGPADAACRS